MRYTPSQPWEMRLLMAAREALDTKHLFDHVQADSSVLKNAYKQCDEITYEHSRTFYMASSLLPIEKRQGARALYAFCRITDDIVDDPHADLSQRQTNLDTWRAEIMADCPPDGSLVCLAWADTRAKFNIPNGIATQLIDGCERDIAQTRYQTFADLAEYSYGVASTVGLMAMHIVGFAGEEALPYAVRLGVALQLTNILRDVAEDWRNGRVYLPQDELAEYGLSEADIDNGIVTDNWRAFMQFQIERARRLYDESLPGIASLDSDGRFAIAAAAELYRAILKDIEDHDYDVFSRRAHIDTSGKLMRLPGIWWRSRTASLP
ncbi:MAG: squalene/phytoene synthase family protein [Chloroflexota bacterium]